VLIGIGIVVLAVVAVPAFAADRGSGSPPDRADKAAKEPKTAITLSGKVRAVTDADGRPTFQLTSGGTTYELDAGPPWYYGDGHPLAPFVGRDVTITGERSEGSVEVDVLTVNGTALREPGPPPWAGGWKRVGEGHPGWSQEKADRFSAKFGDCFPPGLCKQKNRGTAEPDSSEPRLAPGEPEAEPTPTPTPSPSPSATPTDEPTPAPSAMAEPTPTPTPMPSATVEPTPSPSPSTTAEPTDSSPPSEEPSASAAL
jgi:hypothetical protein